MNATIQSATKKARYQVSRVLKFRAYPTEINSDKGVVDDWQDTILVEAFCLDGGSFYNVVQFTGLHDKNGEEIYEGDIIFKEGNPEITKKEYLNQKFTVQFNDSYAKFECVPHTPMPDNHIFMPHIYMCVIMGNIYENPELLKEVPSE